MKKLILLISVILISGLVYASAPLPLKIDFGTASSPVMAGYTQFTATTYSAAMGYGWENTSNIYADTRSSGNDLEIDMHQIDTEKQFFVDVPNGEYNVTFHFYDAVFGQSGINADIEGVNVISNFDLDSGTPITQSFETSVTDSQLTIRMYSSTGGGMILNGMEVTGSGTTCTEQWQCTTWSNCVNGTQTRTCADPNPATTDCPTLPIPAETQSCSIPGVGVIFEDDFDGLNQDYFCGCLGYLEPCGAPLNYSYLDGDFCSGNYGSCTTNLSGEGDREGGSGNNRGMRFYIEEDQYPCGEGGLSKNLGNSYKKIHLRWYMRESTTFPGINYGYQKLFRISDTISVSQIFVPEWVYRAEIDSTIMSLWNATGSTNEWWDVDLVTDITPYTWHSYEIKMDLENKLAEFWIDGASFGEQTSPGWGDGWSINEIKIGGNWAIHNWAYPNEETRDYDDLVISTEYIGPAECPDSVDIEPIGACYCGGSPSPTNTINIHTSGFCCSGVWQATSCSAQCTESWSCTSWSLCVNGTQTRTCTDSNECGTTTSKPPEMQSCSPLGEGVIFEDNFEGWNEIDTDYPDVLCDGNDNIELCRPAGTEWCNFSPYGWSDYGLPDSQVVNSGGRLNSYAFVGNFESRNQPHAAVAGWLPEKNHDELYFRWYVKYDPDW
ncbi:MAG: hypothetical protein ABID38_01200, partial [Candidatus Diapherotrites archaeon]